MFPGVHVAPGQHGWPDIPHPTQEPEMHSVKGVVQVLPDMPVQHGWFGAPQLPQVPFMHAGGAVPTGPSPMQALPCPTHVE